MNPEVLGAKKLYTWLWLSPLLTIPTLLIVLWINPGYKLPCGGSWPKCGYDQTLMVSVAIGIFVSAVWHLVFLLSALHKPNEFVRWHGRQALLLAGIRTAIPLAFTYIDLAELSYSDYIFWSIPVLIAVWLLGTSWGERQSARGDCALMRWTGHGTGLPLLIKTAKPATTPGSAPIIHERSEHRTAYNQGLSLREQGKANEAARVFHVLLVSDASPEFKARVAEELKRTGGADEALTPDVLVAIYRFSPDPEQRRMALSGLESLGLVEAL